MLEQSPPLDPQRSGFSVYRAVSGQIVADLNPKTACEMWVELANTSSPVLRAFRDEIGRLALPRPDTNEKETPTP